MNTQNGTTSVTLQEEDTVERSESYTYIETFLDFTEADDWLNIKLAEIPADYTMYNCGLNYINGKWRVGISFGKSQLEMDFDGS